MWALWKSNSKVNNAGTSSLHEQKFLLTLSSFLLVFWPGTLSTLQPRQPPTKIVNRKNLTLHPYFDRQAVPCSTEREIEENKRSNRDKWPHTYSMKGVLTIPGINEEPWCPESFNLRQKVRGSREEKQESEKKEGERGNERWNTRRGNEEECR